ncbi:hypothetical protein [Candidatus Palauibacter sp.]|uniref:hypothetical protein n=1 Tax=Candidatus Palauibacter sp. TaxID=3101350 RepID=UPI003B01345D
MRRDRPIAAAEPKLLSGGNPQIPKGDGDAPVQAYIAAMPDWKREVGRYFHIHEDDEMDEDLLAGWLRQAAALPGEDLFS